MNEKQLLTPDQVAQRLGTKRTFVFGLLRDGRLRRLKVGRLTRITEEDLARYVGSLESEAAGDAEADESA